MRTGNVVKLKSGNIIIVVSVSDDVTRWVSFEYENMSGTTRNKSYTETKTCWECVENGTDSDCETCKGTGEFEKTYDGMEGSILLASNVKEYIMKKLTKNWF